MTSPQCQRNTRASAVLPLPVMFDLSRSQRVETRFKGATLMDYLMCTDSSYTASTGIHLFLKSLPFAAGTMHPFIFTLYFVTSKVYVRHARV
jgi:hypothetical protein